MVAVFFEPFTPVTFPFLATFAIFELLDDHLTVAPFGKFLTDSVVLSPAITVAVVLLSFGFFDAAIVSVTGTIEITSTNVSTSAKALFIVVLIPSPRFLFGFF
jgi:hypothetical protein